MFNLGLWEIFILAAVALIVVGPEKLPQLARDVARFLNEVKRTTGSITEEVNKAMDEEDFQNEGSSKESLNSTASEKQFADQKFEDPLDREKEKTDV